MQAAIKTSPSGPGEFNQRSGGYLASRIIAAAAPCFNRRKEHENEDSANKMAALIEHFFTEVLEKAWGADDAWSDVELGGIDKAYSPLQAAAKAGSMELVRAVLKNARRADVASAAYRAYCEGHTGSEVFGLLIEAERCIETDGAPLVTNLFRSLHGPDEEPIALYMQREELLEKFLRKWPQTVSTAWPLSGEDRCERALEAAISCRSVKIFDTVLSLGSQLRYKTTERVIDGEIFMLYPTLYYAFLHPSLPVMTALVGLGILENWQVKYNEKDLTILGGGFAAILLSCYPRVGAPVPPGLPSYRPDGLDTLNLVLSAGFSNSWMFNSEDSTVNICLWVLVRPIMAEEHIIDLLSRCKAAGIDILHMTKEEVGKPHGVALITRAASTGLNKVLDFAIELQGPASVDDWYEVRNRSGETVKRTPLIASVANRQLATVQRLLRVHKAKAAYRGSDFVPRDQPVVLALMLKDDEASLPFIQELVRADPLLCDVRCFCGKDVALPIMLCCGMVLPRCLEALLSGDPADAKEMCTQLTRATLDSGNSIEATPICSLANLGRWNLLAIILRHFPDLPVTASGRIVRPDGTLVRIIPSVVESAKRNGAPRPLLLKLKAIAKQQQADADKAEVIAANSAVPSNAFEEPRNKVLSEAEEKRKAKKREQKKKANAKKRAAAATKEGRAGAGKEEGEASNSDSDSSGPDDEEEGMDEEERMLARAPTFDLEKEKAARKARAEAEKSKESQE
jgi:hypothetical protein